MPTHSTHLRFLVKLQIRAVGNKMPVKSLKDKKDKPRKDPNAPKKPSGAYIFYCNAKRDEVKRKNPDFNVAQVGKALGELWKQETLEAKQPYYDLADKDKQRYARQIAEYNKSFQS